MVALVLSTVLIQIVVAILLKQLADSSLRSHWLVAGIIAAAAGLNGIRFLVWGYTNKHYPLSSSYPLTALFFPCILLVSAAYGEPIAWGKVGAVLVIVAGLTLTTPERSAHG